MNGSILYIAGKPYLVTQPELWERSQTEAQYFHILRERQRKGGDYEPLIIPDKESGIIPGALSI